MHPLEGFGFWVEGPKRTELTILGCAQGYAYDFPKNNLIVRRISKLRRELPEFADLVSLKFSSSKVKKLALLHNQIISREWLRRHDCHLQRELRSTVIL